MVLLCADRKRSHPCDDSPTATSERDWRRSPVPEAHPSEDEDLGACARSREPSRVQGSLQLHLRPPFACDPQECVVAAYGRAPDETSPCRAEDPLLPQSACKTVHPVRAAPTPHEIPTAILPQLVSEFGHRPFATRVPPDSNHRPQLRAVHHPAAYSIPASDCAASTCNSYYGRSPAARRAHPPHEIHRRT